MRRIVDLSRLVRLVYYPKFRGSFSVKKVLPVLAPELSYDVLEIGNGDTAIARFARMARGEIANDEIDQTRQQLLEYCKLDTLAMVRLHEQLEMMVDGRAAAATGAGRSLGRAGARWRQAMIKGAVQSQVGLLGRGKAFVASLPVSFDLGKELRQAHSIKLAIAFVSRSGWKSIEGSIRRSKAQLSLLTGLDFCLTDPLVLRDWLRLAGHSRSDARIYIDSSVTFHPKVLIVTGPKSKFAVVGSGNLTAGGLQNNVECSMFVHDRMPCEGWRLGRFGFRGYRHNKKARRRADSDGHGATKGAEARSKEDRSGTTGVA